METQRDTREAGPKMTTNDICALFSDPNGLVMSEALLATRHTIDVIFANAHELVQDELAEADLSQNRIRFGVHIWADTQVHDTRQSNRRLLEQIHYTSRLVSSERFFGNVLIL